MNKQELIEKLEELTKVFEGLQNRINEIKEKINNLNDYGFEVTLKGWEPDYGECYFVANNCFMCEQFENRDLQCDERTIQYNRVFKTEEECQLYCDIQRAFRDASREFVDGGNNYYFWYNTKNGDIGISFAIGYKNAMLYFDSEETIQNLIDKFGEENVKRYYLGVY